ncbi:AsmA-like C-terminal region-containing protein [uncultured Microscilla sp.]|uniref:AsmA-like C-terminal region-containing protein n=1 Tax=uncultured Microscilla sp. TaxID=432653 RepID=UPI00260CEBDE|nr:AsmA-like C-terminal region-containing protein [uncultured Microscilla sp.]
MRKFFRRFFIFILILSAVAALVAIGAALFYTPSQKAKVEKEVKERLTRSLKTNIKTGEVNFDFTTNFPALTLTIHQVQIEGKPHRRVFANIDKLQFTLDFNEYINGRYTFKTMEIDGGQINFLVNNNGEDNYSFFDLAAQMSDSTVKFSVEHIKLKNLKIAYQNIAQKEAYNFTVQNIASTVAAQPQFFDLDLSGKLTTLNFQANGYNYLKQEEVTLGNSKISFNRNKGRIDLHPLQITLRKSDFELKGYYDIKKRQADFINLEIAGTNKDLKALTVFMPAKVHNKLLDYKTKGNVDFKGAIKGNWSAKAFPHVEIDFGCRNIAIQSPNIEQVFQRFSFIGKFSNGRENNLNTSFLKVDRLKGSLKFERVKDLSNASIRDSLKSENLRGSFELRNFTNPYISLRLDAGLDLEAFTEFYPLDMFKKAEGLFGLKLYMEGLLDDLTKEKEADDVRITGAMELKNVNFILSNNPLEFKDFSGDFEFNNNTTTIQSFAGQVGKSDFAINGLLKNLMPYLLLHNTETSTARIEGNLVARKLDMAELLQKASLGTSSENKVNPQTYTLHVPSDIAFNFKCKVDSIQFRPFVANNFTCDLAMNDKVLKTSNIHMNIAGGTMNVLGIFNAQKDNFFTFDGRMQFNKVQANQLMAAFGNFSQNFIQSSNINGLLTADVEAGLVFNKHMEVNLPNVVADIDAKVTNGTLVNFAPVKQPFNYINLRVDNLPFTEMRQVLQIRNETVFMPEVTIQSTVSPLSIIGSYTVDKGFNYKVKIPLANYQQRNIRIDPNSSVLIDKRKGSAIYYVTIKGGLDDLRGNYTKVPDKTNLEQNWSKEKRYFINLFNRTSLSGRALKIDTINQVYFDN